jgi:hypothetical protein
MKNTLINNTFKKVFAFEFLYLISVSLISLSIYLIGNRLELSNQKKLETKKKERDEKLEKLPRKQFLWFNLKKEKLYNKDYKKFVNEYKKFEDQLTLFQLVNHTGLYTLSLEDFREKYFIQDYTIERCYTIYYNLPPYHFYPDSFNHNLFRKKLIDFKMTLRNKLIFEKVYNMYTRIYFTGSKEDLHNILFAEENINFDYSDLPILNYEEVPKFNSYKHIGEYIIWGLIILVFPFRYLLYLVKWSFSQLNK